MNDAPASTLARPLLALAAALAIAACGAEEDTATTYEADVTDESGGELIVTDPQDPAVEDVQLPDTPMTPVPAGAPTATPTPE